MRESLKPAINDSPPMDLESDDDYAITPPAPLRSKRVMIYFVNYDVKWVATNLIFIDFPSFLKEGSFVSWVVEQHLMSWSA